jgi:magnesium-protoporphyrin O-methyltransferase
MNQALNRIEQRYRGEVGRRWRRIGTGRPSGYWEENVASGQHRAAGLIVSWLEPVEGRPILDAGCGAGALARRLAARGAAVTAIDLVAVEPGPESPPPGTANPVFLTGDFLEMLRSGKTGGFDAIVLHHVLEDYPDDGQRQILRAAGDSGTHRIYLTFRIPGTGSHLLAPLWPEGLREAIEPIPLLRWIHLNTPFRQTRQQRIGRRNYRAQVSELTRSRSG